MAKINDLPLLSNPTEDMYCLVGKEDLQKVPWSAIMGQIGAPYIATTVAGMTDKTRVYVYQGSESGYTSGNWYYWNGSAWTSGGTYNSAAVNTDKTLTQSDKPADSAVVGQQIGSLKEDISNKITKFYASNQGETHITDSDNGKIQDMMIYGKSSQDGMPTTDNPVEIKSVVNPTVKVSNKDGTKSQTVTLPYTLNAIPVSSGGNVTINGQQYVADYVDVVRGKIVKCIEKYRISSGLKWIYEPSENDRFGAYGLNININPNFGGNTLFTHYQNKPNGIGGFIAPGNIRLHNFQGFTDLTNFKEWLDKNESYAYFVKNTLEEIDLTTEEIQIFKELATYYPTTNISVNSEQLDGYTVFNYPISMANGWNYVKQQLNDNRDYIYDMDIQSAEAYVNSEYAVALTELEV